MFFRGQQELSCLVLSEFPGFMVFVSGINLEKFSDIESEAEGYSDFLIVSRKECIRLTT